MDLEDWNLGRNYGRSIEVKRLSRARFGRLTIIITVESEETDD